MVMKIKATEFIKKLESAPKELDSKIDVLLNNAENFTAAEFRDFRLPEMDVVCKMKAQQIKASFGLSNFAVLQKQSDVNLSKLKYAPEISKHDASLITMGECVKLKLCTAKEFGQKIEEKIFNNTQQKDVKIKPDVVNHVISSAMQRA